MLTACSLQSEAHLELWLQQPQQRVVVATTPHTATREPACSNKDTPQTKKKKDFFLSWFVEIKLLLKTESLTKEVRIYNGEKTISLTSGAGKTGQPLVKE